MQIKSAKHCGKPFLKIRSIFKSIIMHIILLVRKKFARGLVSKKTGTVVNCKKSKALLLIQSGTGITMYSRPMLLFEVSYLCFLPTALAYNFTNCLGIQFFQTELGNIQHVEDAVFNFEEDN